MGMTSIIAFAAGSLALGAMVYDASRGYDNNNPGNLDRMQNGDVWIGEVECDDSRFSCFENVYYGYRALAKTLLTYQDKHKLVTIRQMINRYAPTSENQTSDYIKFVCSYLAYSPDEPINLRDIDNLRGLMAAITVYENGRITYMPTIYKAAKQVLEEDKQ